MNFHTLSFKEPGSKPLLPKVAIGQNISEILLEFESFGSLDLTGEILHV